MVDLFIYSENKEQESQYNLIVFLMGSVRGSNCIKLECYIHTYWSVSDRSPKIIISRMIRYVGHWHM